jgi:hypothetical protein
VSKEWASWNGKLITFVGMRLFGIDRLKLTRFMNF